jgi:hypothetical protein
MLEIGAYGTVRGEAGNILTYSAWGKPAVRLIGGIEETSGAPSQAGAVQRVKDPPG